MKKFLALSLLLGNFVFAEEATKPTVPPQAQENQNKMTTRDAKKSCKEEGKTGAELIKCMKEKKDEK